MRTASFLAFAVATMSCSGGSPPTGTPPVVTPMLTSIAVTATNATLPVGGTLALTATPRDQLGRVMSAALTWTSSAASIATVSSQGVVAGVTAGSATIQAANGGVSGRITVTVTGPISYTAGQSYFGRNGYIEYIAGNAPVILTAPHGGSLAPGNIPDRTASSCGGAATTVTDTNTGELVRAMQQRFFAQFGTYPHVIISLLSRRKLDPNRVSPEADCGNADAAAALEDWHAFINTAKSAVLQASGKGWYMDMHGHGHAIQRLELGYLLADADLNRTDAALDATASFENLSSIRTVSQVSPVSFATLLRGPNSLGSLYANNGFPALPSAGDPSPNGADYFNGGDNTVRHSCGSGATALGGTSNGNICGVQVESNFTGVRDNAANRDRFGTATAIVLEEYLRVHWGLRLAPP